MQIWKLNNKKWRHNNVITKNNGKIQTFSKPKKLYIIQKVLIQNVIVIAFEPLWQKLLTFF